MDITIFGLCRYEEAVEFLDKVIAIDPNSKEALHTKGIQKVLSVS